MRKAKPAVPINFIFPLQVYPFDLMVSINESSESIKRKLRRKGVDYNLEMIEYGGGAGRYVIYYEHTLCLIRLPELPRKTSHYAALVHEILHVVISVLRSVGMKISEDGESDEAYTYLISFITKEIFERINKYY